MIDVVCLLKAIARQPRLSGISAGAPRQWAVFAGSFPHYPLVRYPLRRTFKVWLAGSGATSGERARHKMPVISRTFNGEVDQTHTTACVCKASSPGELEGLMLVIWTPGRRAWKDCRWRRR